MQIGIYQRHESGKAKGLCIVIDVLRAFTTAAFAFASGAKEIILVSTAEEAFALYNKDNSLVLMGEVDGEPIAGFHYGNSPAEIQNAFLSGNKMVQRTSAGTQGVIGCGHAERMLIASFVVAEATLKFIRKFSPPFISFIVTGTKNGDEDLALAEYLQSRLSGKETCPSSYLERVLNSPSGKMFANPALPEFSQADLSLAMQIDQFPFAMEVNKVQQNFVARKIDLL